MEVLKIHSLTMPSRMVSCICMFLQKWINATKPQLDPTNISTIEVNDHEKKIYMANDGDPGKIFNSCKGHVFTFETARVCKNAIINSICFYLSISVF